MADDIEAFLKRAAQRRKGQGGQAAPQPPPAPKPVRPRVRPAPVQPEQILEAELVEEPISRLTNRHLQEDHLAQQVGLADDKMDAHIHDVFDHSVGRLKRKERKEQVQTDSSVESLLALLQSPTGLQQAVILREIFDRPDHRW